jgi:hypothetical protein
MLYDKKKQDKLEKCLEYLTFYDWTTFGLKPNYEPFGLKPNYEPFGLKPNYEHGGL